MMLPLSLEKIRELAGQQERFNEMKRTRISAKMNQALNLTPVMNDPVVTRIHGALLNAMVNIRAQRLHAGDRSRPLLDTDDTDFLVECLMDALWQNMSASQASSDTDAEKKEMINFLQQLVTNVIRAEKEAHLETDSSPYDEFWKWASITKTLADDHRISIDEFLSLTDSCDLITRQLYSREQFAQRSARAQAALDGEGYINAIMAPTLDPIKDPDECNKKKERLLAENGTLLRNTRDFMQVYNQEELMRLYGPASEPPQK